MMSELICTDDNFIATTASKQGMPQDKVGLVEKFSRSHILTGNWKRRHFRLRQGKLEYFQDIGLMVKKVKILSIYNSILMKILL